jgi:uncharacterized membrane protein
MPQADDHRDDQDDRLGNEPAAVAPDAGYGLGRLLALSDAVFAIAMTLLVVGIGIPHVRDSKISEALGNKDNEIFGFFLSFLVIGLYWLAHHRFFSRLVAVDVRFMKLNLVYLAAIAFMPFPTALVGVYGSAEAVVIVLYAITLAVASLVEAAMFWHAQRAGLLRKRLEDRAFRSSMIASVAPAAVFAISIPIAVLYDPGVALLSWLLIFPAELLIGKYLHAEET